MNRDELTELQYIAPMTNVPSILTHGLLSHKRVEVNNVPHESVAMPEMQLRRSTTILPTNRYLHEYVNLYFHARNPMLFLRKELHLTLCVLRISTDVLDIPGTVITDRNAAADYPRWYASPKGLAYLDKATIFAEDWRHPGNPRAYWNHKVVKCAEVLVPDSVGVEHIKGAYVSCERARRTLARVASTLPITVDGHLFFQV